MILDLVFILHALASLLFALPLLFDPSGFSNWFAGAPLTTEGVIFGRLYGGCLVLIAHATFRATLAYSYYARNLVLWVMLVQQLLGVALCFTFASSPAFLMSLLFFVVFALGYLYVLIFRPGDI